MLLFRLDISLCMYIRAGMSLGAWQDMSSVESIRSPRIGRCASETYASKTRYAIGDIPFKALLLVRQRVYRGSIFVLSGRIS